MGLFDNTSTSTTQAQDFGKVDLNNIVGFIGKILPFIQAIMPLLQKWYVSQTHTDHEKVLGERLLDQVPGIYLLLAKAGLFDDKTIAFLQQRPFSAELTDRHYGSLDKVLPIAQSLFTILFGVRIMDGHDLDALDRGVDAYYNVGTTTQMNTFGVPLVRFHKHDDIPRAAVERAVMLKQKFFPISTYNRKQWDMNKFQEYPLVAPVPGLVYGLLYSGPIPLGGELLEGILINAGPFMTQQGAGDMTTIPDPVAGGGADGLREKWPLLAGGALLLLGLYYMYDSDT